MAKYEGTCPNCGKIHYSNRKDDIITCDCWQHCAICGAEMAPYNPDLTPNTYGVDGKRELQTLMACTRHSPPFFSVQKPVEVVCK
jgi:hypothetical protein